MSLAVVRAATVMTAKDPEEGGAMGKTPGPITSNLCRAVFSEGLKDHEPVIGNISTVTSELAASFLPPIAYIFPPR